MNTQAQCVAGSFMIAGFDLSGISAAIVAAVAVASFIHQVWFKK